jgi:prepilin-type N-terminal cleavage/methylation domain-containing protein
MMGGAHPARFAWWAVPTLRALRQRGFTLVELLIVVALLAALFGGMVRLTDGLRDRAKSEQTRRLLEALGSAVEQYAALHSSSNSREAVVYPPGRFDGAAGPCLRALLGAPETRGPLAELGWPWNRLMNDPGAWVDAWGRPLRYVTALHDEQAVRMNGGKPFWVSAGPDGRFGDADLAERSDNISSDEPM